MTESNVYTDAANYIREHGWRVGVPVDDISETCVLGAIAAVTNAHWNHLPTAVMNPVASVVAEQYPEWENQHSKLRQFPDGVASMYLYDWNDKVVQSGDEVIMVLEKAAARDDGS